MIKSIRMVGAYLRLIWYLLKFLFNLFYGIWKLSRLNHAPVSIFGGTHLSENSIYMKKAKKLAIMLSDHDIPILTGGGPGIMEAASCGASHLKKSVISTIGISVRGLSPKGFNKCVENSITMNDFRSRKWLLIKYSVGFAVFPGGFGTLDELAELLTLIQNKKRTKAPIVLIGIEYWGPFVDWIKNSALKNGLIEEEDFKLFSLTDDINEAFDLLRAHCLKREFKLFQENK